MPARPGQRGKWGNILAFVKWLLAPPLPLRLFCAGRKPPRPEGPAWRLAHQESVRALWPGAAGVAVGQGAQPFLLSVCRVEASMREKKKGGRTIEFPQDLQTLLCSWPLNRSRGCGSRTELTQHHKV